MKSNWKINRYRLFFQLGVVAILLYLGGRMFVDKAFIADFEAYCPMGGLQALGSFIVNESLACSMTSMQISMGMLLFVLVALFSKLFCSHICPLGTITEWLGRSGEKMKLNVSISGLADKLLRMVKYLLLLVVFYFTMETSELVCKTFDPYFAVATGYGTDVNVWLASIAIAVLLIGSFFVKMFWCKYACPLGAIMNTFRNVWLFIVIICAYFVMQWIGVQFHFIWALTVLALLGYLREIGVFTTGSTQAVSIRRNADTCIDCGKCDKACVQEIEVSKYDKVNHADCHLCGECTLVCPVDNTLTVSKRKLPLWAMSLIVLAFIGGGILLGNQFEVPTVDLFWGDKDNVENIETFTMEGLKDVKCYGSSMSFVEHVRKVPGVLGAATFVGTNRVQVEYDADRISASDVKRAIFEPAKMRLADPVGQEDSLAIVEVAVDNFFDAYDSFFMSELLKQFEPATIYGFESVYGEPVVVKLFVGTGSFQEEALQKHIEQEEVVFMEEGVKYTEDIAFKVASITKTASKVSVSGFMTRMFRPYDATANNAEQYSDDQTAHFRVKILGYPWNSQMGPHLRNDVARCDTGIVRLKTYYAKEYPVADFTYVKELTDSARVWQQITKDTLTITYTNGMVRQIQNPFSFERFGSR